MTFLRRHALISGIILMFLLTWPIDLANSGVLPFQVPFAVYIMLGWGFVIASVIMTWLTLGKDGVVRLLKQFLIWRVERKWFLVALLLFPTIQLTGVIVNAAITGALIDFSTVYAYQIFGPPASLPMFVIPFFVFDAITNGEEIGWRGYVLPRLQARSSALVSSLILGMIWGLWHIPKFLAPGNSSPFGWFMLKIIVEAILYTWLYNSTKGSLLLTTLFHAAGNTGGVFFPVANTISGANHGALIVQVAIEAVVAAAVILIAGPARLSPGEPKQIRG